MEWFGSVDYVAGCALVFMFALALDQIFLHVGLTERRPRLVPHRKLRAAVSPASEASARLQRNGAAQVGEKTAARRGSADTTTSVDPQPAPGELESLPGAGTQSQSAVGRPPTGGGLGQQAGAGNPDIPAPAVVPPRHGEEATAGGSSPDPAVGGTQWDGRHVAGAGLPPAPATRGAA